jgi:hypothetical protein
MIKELIDQSLRFGDLWIDKMASSTYMGFDLSTQQLKGTPSRAGERETQGRAKLTRN